MLYPGIGFGIGCRKNTSRVGVNTIYHTHGQGKTQSLVSGDYRVHPTATDSKGDMWWYYLCGAVFRNSSDTIQVIIHTTIISLCESERKYALLLVRLLLLLYMTAGRGKMGLQASSWYLLTEVLNRQR